ncbi:MAG: hypothetical protein MJ057_07765 [Sphaerochaetaceae bacterium]|nr:hypothetical protein [Sphaerochaetaceae bacterium]
MNSRETFTNYLNALDNQYYFFIAGNLLGKVQTPFHKPQLSQKIVSFLSNEDNRKNLFASLDDMEIRYLTLVHLLGGASDKDLSTFFCDDKYPVIVTKMENLCDRLVVIRCQDRYEINPILRNDMANGVLDLKAALGEDKTCDETAPIVDRNVIFAVLNLYLSGAIPAREANFHHFVKSDKLQTLFPQFEKARILEVLRTISAFIMGRIGASILRDTDVSDSQKNLKDVLCMDSASFAIHAIANHVNGRKISMESALCKAMEILRFHSLTEDQALSILTICSGASEAAAKEALNLLRSFNLVICHDGFFFANSMLWQQEEPRSVLRTDSNLTVSYYGHAHVTDILYRFADVMVCDKVISYQITRESYIRGLDSGLTKKEILDYLGDSSLDLVFGKWETAYRRVQAYSGILVRCQDEQASQIVSMHPEIKSHIIMDLGNGMFLMNRSTTYQWEGPLARALDLQHIQIMEPSDPDEDADPFEEPQGSYPAFDFANITKPANRIANDSWQSIATELLEDAKSKGCLNSEVEALIHARIIYSKSQLDSSFNYNSLLSASGFDYNAKMTLLRDVIRAKNAIVVLELAEEVLVTKPFEILKGEGRNSILKVKVLPDSIEKSIPVSSIFKISVVRK